MTKIFKKRSFRIRVTIILSFAPLFFLMALLANHPGAVERYYSEGLYPVICRIFHPVFNIFPFSIGDVIYSLVVIWLIYILVRFIRILLKKQWELGATLMLNVVVGVEIAVAAFYLFWGLNYYRPQASELLGLRDSDYTTADLRSVTAELIDSANACRERIGDGDLEQSNNTIYQTAIKAVNQLEDSSSVFRAYHPGIKPSLLTPLLNYLGTSGYYNPFTSESQVNYQMPVFTRPFVACHELSHQMGFGPEDEANFAGFIAGIHSHDKLLRYSAYHEGVQEFMFALRHQDSIARKELLKSISPKVLADFKTEREYWLAYEGRVERISSVFYDNFLKANNQPYGLRTYNRMVLLVLAYRKKQQL